MALIIVESPTKARTFNRLLQGQDYYVFATMGHIRDLPAQKIAIDYDNNFKPEYKIIPKKSSIVKALGELSQKNQEIILATDPDREGESISYHVACILGLIKERWPDFVINPKKKQLKRIVFHEITRHALEEALSSPTELRTSLIKAQQSRRILDRIVGYELSPLLWKKTGKNWLSAGRVQTVALRLIVEREKEITRFIKEPYYQMYGLFKTPAELRAKLIEKSGDKFEQTIKLPLFAGQYEYVKTSIDTVKLQAIENDLKKDAFCIAAVKEEVVKRYPPPPLTTSLLQQEGFNRFGFSSKTVMKLAQDLYEHGLISYHRTDSFNLSTQFVFRAKEYIAKTYGEEYALEKPRGYKTRSKSAQEAHEAIRPTRIEKKADEINKGGLGDGHKKLYQLIWNRAVATQMKEAEIKQTKISIKSSLGYGFECDHHQVVFDGFLKILNPDFVKNHLSALSIRAGDQISLISIEKNENLTEPPPRYTEASLIKIMEEKGIGRPSTYAPIVSLIQTKGYVEKNGRYFIPTNLGVPLSDYLAKAFPQIFDINFTASLENSLDGVANGQEDMIKVLSDFYMPFKEQLKFNQTDEKKILIKEEIEEKCPKCGKPLVTRYSRFGKFYACSGYPACRYIKPYLKIVANRTCPDCGGNIVVRFTKTKRRFFGCSNYPKCKYSTWTINDKSPNSNNKSITKSQIQIN